MPGETIDLRLPKGAQIQPTLSEKLRLFGRCPALHRRL